MIALANIAYIADIYGENMMSKFLQKDERKSFTRAEQDALLEMMWWHDDLHKPEETTSKKSPTN